MDRTYDLVVVGAGSAGLTAAPFASALQAKVLLVERDRIGGDCTWTGCVPSKALIHTAGIVHAVRAAGLSDDPLGRTIDTRRVMDRVHAAVEGVYASETPETLAEQGIEVAFGAARFIGPDAVAVNDTGVTGRRFVICTGADPVVPPIAGLADVPFYTYKDVFSLEALPRRLLVLGSGPVGAELAQAFRRLGSEVWIAEAADRLLPRADPDASTVLLDRFKREGIEVHLRSTVDRIEGSEGQVAAIAGETRIEGDALLVAVGRRPRLDELDLGRANVATNPQGITVDTKLRTSNPRVYAAGDAAGSLHFTHYAGWQGFTAARNALLPGAARGTRDGVPWVVFTDPEVGQVGLTEQDARRRHEPVEVERLPLERIDRAQTTGDLDGFIKLITRNHRLVGATVVAPVAGEIINELAVAIRAGATLRDLSSTIHVYPTYGLGIQQIAARATTNEFARGWQGRLLRRLARRSGR